jgi:hypothetical protein
VCSLVALLLVACDGRAQEWTGWAYPDAETMATSVTLSGFKSFEECQAATIGRLQSFPEPSKGTYECGYMCRWDPQLQANVCKEKRK